MNWLKWVVIGVLVLLVVGVGVFVYNQGIKRGVEVTTDAWVLKMDSLQQWTKQHPPSPDTVPIFITKPPMVVAETLPVVVESLFQKDTVITNRYPYLIWSVSYDNLGGSLTVITANGQERHGGKIGSFSIVGDKNFTFSSTPWTSPVSAKTMMMPFVRTNLTIIVNAYPDYINLKEFGSATTKLEYGVIFLNQLQLAVGGGLGWDKSRDPKFYPFLGISASYRLFGKY
jgi:hypothetical protein